MASSSQESVKFELECDILDDEFLENVDFHLVESLVEKQKSIPQENTTSPLTAVENMMLRGDSLTISDLARDSDSPPQPKPKSSRFFGQHFI